MNSFITSHAGKDIMPDMDMEPLDQRDFGMLLRVDKNGLNKDLTRAQAIEIARTAPGTLTLSVRQHRLGGKANILVKAGWNGKWYMKKCNQEDVARLLIQADRKTEHARDGHIVYVIDWASEFYQDHYKDTEGNWY